MPQIKDENGNWRDIEGLGELPAAWLPPDPTTAEAIESFTITDSRAVTPGIRMQITAWDGSVAERVADKVEPIPDGIEIHLVPFEW